MKSLQAETSRRKDLIRAVVTGRPATVAKALLEARWGHGGMAFTLWTFCLHLKLKVHAIAAISMASWLQPSSVGQL